MRIGIDIDDVITDTSIAIKEYMDEYGKDEEISKYIVEIMRGEVPTPRIAKFLNEEAANFFDRTKIKPDAARVINKLYHDGNEIFLITSRGNLRYKGSEEKTLQFLKEKDIPYTKIIFNSHDKAKICNENDIDLMIDDSVKFCEEIKKENRKSIVFTSIVNRNIETQVPRVESWLELEEMFEKMEH